MKKYLTLLNSTKLFQSIEETEIESMLDCLSAYAQIYQKGECIFHRGERITSVAMLLEGCTSIFRKRITGEI